MLFRSKLLKSIAPNMKTQFNSDHISSLYYNYLAESETPSTLPFSFSKDKPVLLVASGPSIKEHQTEIDEFIKKYSPVVITLNHYSDWFKTDFSFFSNQRRYIQYSDIIQKNNHAVIISSHISDTPKKNEHIINLTHLSNKYDIRSENVAIFCLAALHQYNVKTVYFAGLDGFQSNLQSYANLELRTQYTLESLTKKNQEIKSDLNYFVKNLLVRFITPSIYRDVASQTCLGVIPARYASSRFPGKPLVKIDGIPMIKRTYLQAKKSSLLTDVIVATDSDEIIE